MDLFGNSRTIALSIDGLAIRMLIYSGKKIERWYEIPVNPVFIRDGLVSDAEEVGIVLADAMRDKEIPRAGVISALSSAGSATQILSFPRLKVKPKKMEDMVHREMRRLMPGSVDADYIFWRPLPDGTLRAKQSIYVLAIPRSNIVNMVEVCRIAGVTTKAMELKPFALARAVNCRAGIILHCEVDNVEIVIVDKGFPGLFRNIPIKEVSTSPDEACQHVVRELPFTVDFYNRSHPDSDVAPETPIYLSGGLALVPGTAEKIEKGTARKVEKIVPPLECPDNFPLEHFLPHVGLMLRSRW
jgi:Tfp pilus assembly PilM family ATPase